MESKPGIGGVAALPPAASKIPERELMLLGYEGDGKAACGP